MKFSALFVMFLWEQQCFFCNSQISSLDDLIGPYRFFRHVMNQIQKNALKEPFSNNVRIQKATPKSVPFPCTTANSRSPVKPSSVHALKPGDIDVVGAIGDSMLAGYAVTASNMLTMVSDTRGMSFPIGGDYTWREITTLPNILKEFNPELIGSSKGVSMTVEKESQFNVADDGAISANIPFMTKNLIKRILSDPRVNVTTDWKMITILIGANDFCSEICYYKQMDKYVLGHRRDLQTTLRLLKKYLPRTFVNLIIAPDVSALADFTNMTLMCTLSQRMSCPCFIGLPTEGRRGKSRKVLAKSRQLQFDITLEPEFESDDFAVVAQPFLWNTKLPMTKKGETDWTYFGLDCFHFSQKAHSLAAKALWQNLLEPVGMKSDKFELDNILNLPLACPTEERPYFFTNRNSKS